MATFERLKKKKGFWASLVFMVFLLVLIFLIGFFLFSGGKEKRPVRLAKPTPKENPTPKKKTESPTLAEAQYRELLWLKKRGLWWEGPEDRGGAGVRRVYIPPPAAGVVPEAKRREQENLWAIFYNQPAPGKGTILAGIGGDVAGAGEGTTSRFFACSARASTLDRVIAIPGKKFPVRFILEENCGPLPAGAIVLGAAEAQRAILRATVELQEAEVDGKILPISGYVLGPDGEYGIGYKVVRNDLKAFLIESILASVAEGSRAAADAADEDKVVCGEWGCVVAKDTEHPLRVGVQVGLGSLADRVIKTYVESLKATPVVIEAPAGFPVTMYLKGQVQHGG